MRRTAVIGMAVPCLGHSVKAACTPRVTVAFFGPRGGTHGVHDLDYEQACALRDKMIAACEELPRRVADEVLLNAV